MLYWTDKNNYPFAYKQRIQDGTQHIYILRYADLLLLKAEAKEIRRLLLGRQL